MRLIDADALQRRICGAKCGCEYEDCGNEGDCGYDHFIFHAPTIDAVPVVRCRECIHRYMDKQSSEVKELYKLIEILETMKYCDEKGIKINKEKKIEALDTTIVILNKLIKNTEQQDVESVVNIENMEINIYDEEETYPDCTVQVLKNSVTGKVSVGWWKNS